MKFEITHAKARVAGGLVEIGEVIDIGKEVPPSLIGKGRIVGEKAEKVAVTNPAKDSDAPFERVGKNSRPG